MHFLLRRKFGRYWYKQMIGWRWLPVRLCTGFFGVSIIKNYNGRVFGQPYVLRTTVFEHIYMKGCRSGYDVGNIFALQKNLPEIFFPIQP